MIASRAAHHAPKSLKNLSSMRRTIPESFSCGKTKLRASHSAARKQFAKGFSAEEMTIEENQLNSSCSADAGRIDYAGPRRTRKTAGLGRSSFACAIAQS